MLRVLSRAVNKSFPILPLLLCGFLAACANAPITQQPSKFFLDSSFAPPAAHIDPAIIFAVSPEMRQYLEVEIADQLRAEGKQQGLFNALYRKDQLKLEYDAAMTRTAAEAFAAHAGNCLSLTIMTAALARELGLSVHYQRVFTDENWSRSGNIYFSSGHVNLTLGRRELDPRLRLDEVHLMTIDFFPVGQFEVQHTWGIEEKTIVAMFMNNRAAEELVRGKLDDAYWWAREGIVEDPNFLSTFNTLGVIYRRHGNLHEAEQALRFALDHEPTNIQAMSNLAMVLNDQGRKAEAADLNRQVAQLEPTPPYYFFNLGQAALRAKDYKRARELFAKEVAREGGNPEFHFWLAIAYVGLGETKLAQQHLSVAMENSLTRHDYDLYAAKLDGIKAASRQ
jgi:tetratricopeptide (TPR) repeat protein